MRKITKHPQGILKNVRCRISGLPVNLVVESGASASLRNSNIVNSLRPRPHSEQSNVKLSAYTGSPVNMLGTVRLKLHFSSQYLSSFPFHVVRFCEILIGMDLFDAMGFSLSERN